MKTTVLIAYVLTIVATAYSFSSEKSAQFHEYVKQCTEEVDVSQEAAISSVLVMICVSYKQDMIDAQDNLIKEKVLQLFEDIIVAPEDVSKAKQSFLGCWNKVGESENGRNKTEKVVECGISIAKLFA